MAKVLYANTDVKQSFLPTGVTDSRESRIFIAGSVTNAVERSQSSGMREKRMRRTIDMTS